ncbi:hypothetical protein NPIL_253901 [Nephila pilipes]|uniref:Uncharacterized protein n=1 Tax=Nephila pilipes TaxID=299642 RepID=A0A8X6I7T6_NEPPI|nr:hypothetical protein NPIL_253901 [Nephila pilipes]
MQPLFTILIQKNFRAKNLLSTKLKEGFCFDNLVSSNEDESQLTELKIQVQHIMKEGCFEKRCWEFSGLQDVDDQMVLGLKWNVHTDELYCVQSSSLKNEAQL